jgi:uncharacterized protein (DUF4213/DUF364 family)
LERRKWNHEPTNAGCYFQRPKLIGKVYKSLRDVKVILMTVREKIKEVALKAAKGVSVEDARIGLVYTAVLLDNGQIGVAYTFHDDNDLVRRCCDLKGLRPLAGRRVEELLSLFDSTHNVESALALAASNALFNSMRDGLKEGDILEHLRLFPSDAIGMVGHFLPMVPMLQSRVSSLKIFEQVDKVQGNLLPQEEAYRQLPQCDVALITSTTIVNDTVDAMLDAVRSCREVVLLGASTPLVPEVFAGTPVTVLSGVVVKKPQEIMRIVSEAGGTRLFRGHVTKVNLGVS